MLDIMPDMSHILHQTCRPVSVPSSAQLPRLFSPAAVVVAVDVAVDIVVDVAVDIVVDFAVDVAVDGACIPTLGELLLIHPLAIVINCQGDGSLAKLDPGTTSCVSPDALRPLNRSLVLPHLGPWNLVLDAEPLVFIFAF